MKLQGSRVLCFCALILAIFAGCKKSDSPNGRGHEAESVKATISGRITDEQNHPISGAIVKVTTGTATTDAGGLFTISDVFVDKNATLVKVEKTGFFLGTKTIVTGVDNNNPVTIALIKKTIAGTFSGTGSGNVTVPAAGGTIQFEANGVVNPTDNKPYTGSVTVSAFFINPAADNFRQIMPGTLRGITNGNEETGLQSFGMMAVELNGEEGQKLQIAPGKKATLHFPITEALRATAPATIPLWSLDETTGLWKEEGSATRQGDEYVGSVSHFSFWNCDAPFAITKFTITVKIQQGQPLTDAEVVITSATADSSSISGSGITSTDGVVNGNLPTNRPLQLKIYDKCHNLLHSKSVGPFTTATDFGVITVNAEPAAVTFSGTVISCANAPLASGYVTLQLEGVYYSIPVSGGSFSKTLMRCNNAPTTATLTPYDMANNVSGSAVSVDVAGSTVNAGKLSACGTAMDSYIKYTLGGVEYLIAPPTDNIIPAISTDHSYAFVGERVNGLTDDILIFISGPEAPGPHNLATVSVYHNNIGFSKYGGGINVNVTEYGTAPGGYIAGTFSCTVSDSTVNVKLPFSCNFRVRR
jgi:hypothetical protein